MGLIKYKFTIIKLFIYYHLNSKKCFNTMDNISVKLSYSERFKYVMHSPIFIRMWGGVQGKVLQFSLTNTFQMN